MTPYLYAEKGRSFRTVFITAFVALLACLFFLVASPVSTVIGAILVVLAISGVYAFLRGETWNISVNDAILSWSYARWPKSSGSIDLSTVRHVVVNDSSSTLSFTFEDGSTRKIKLIGYAGRFRDYLKARFPNITVEFVEGS
jgi:hypothetical protein